MKKGRKKYQRKKPSWFGILILTALAWLLIPIAGINLMITLGAILTLPWWSATFFWLFLGGILYSLFHFYIDQPAFLYVLPHELTHALFAGIFGERIRKIKVRDNGGYVEMTRSNFIIDLAPYFFPFYAFLLTIVDFLLKYFWQYEKYEYLFLLGIGISLAFHYLNSWEVLKYKQTDMLWTGRWFGIVFSVIVNILLLNIIFLLIFYDEKLIILDYYRKVVLFLINMGK